MSPIDALSYLDDLFANQGAEIYLGEEVTLCEHMLQSAVFAERAGAHPALIAAALLHDVGHFANNLPLSEHNAIDRKHQETGASFLATHFPPAVTEPVRLHVVAKRYLCTVEPDYRSRLSDASIHSLDLQGGPLPCREVSDLEANPYLADAVLLRRADDEGKIPGMKTPAFCDYRDLLESMAD